MADAANKRANDCLHAFETWALLFEDFLQKMNCCFALRSTRHWCCDENI